MGALRRLGVALSGVAGWLGLTSTPTDDPARAERIDALYDGYHQEFPDVPRLTVDELVTARAAGEDWVVVDVRSAQERAVSMLPGAIPASVVEEDPGAYRDRSLVSYCTIGYRSGLWASRWRKEGLDVYNLQGSVLSWTHAGQPLITGAGEETRSVHVYGPTWDLARLDYEAVW